MNKYLEKIQRENFFEEEAAPLEKTALNASKARAMANLAGVIPSDHSAWKYALRKLRGPKGELLSGPALSKAKVKLGDVTNNAYQSLKNLDRVHGSRGIEIAGTVDSFGKLEKHITLGGVGGVTPTRRNNIHTHPAPPPSALYAHTLNKTSKNVYKDGRNFSSHELAGPSGVVQGMKDRFSKLMGAYADSDHRVRILNGLSELEEIQPSHDAFSGGSSYVQKIKNMHIQPLKKNYKILSTSEGYNFSKFWGSGHSDLSNVPFNKLERVAAPSAHAVSSYKMTKNGPRIVYFDHTPRHIKSK